MRQEPVKCKLFIDTELCDANVPKHLFVHIHWEAEMYLVPHFSICGLFIYFASPLHCPFVKRKWKRYPSSTQFSIYYYALGKNKCSVRRGALSFEFSEYTVAPLSHFTFYLTVQLFACILLTSFEPQTSLPHTTQTIVGAHISSIADLKESLQKP